MKHDHRLGTCRDPNNFPSGECLFRLAKLGNQEMESRTGSVYPRIPPSMVIDKGLSNSEMTASRPVLARHAFANPLWRSA